MKEIYIKDEETPKSCEKCDLMTKGYGENFCNTSKPPYQLNVECCKLGICKICPLRPLSDHDKQVRAETAREIIRALQDYAELTGGKESHLLANKDYETAARCSAVKNNFIFVANELSEQYGVKDGD